MLSISSWSGTFLRKSPAILHIKPSYAIMCMVHGGRGDMDVGTLFAAFVALRHTPLFAGNDLSSYVSSIPMCPPPPGATVGLGHRRSGQGPR